MERTDSRSVLVVGAGPTGLLLAAQLAEAQVPVRVVDRRPDAVTESRAVAVHARALETLAGLGVADELLARGRRVSGFALWDGRRRLTRIDFGRLDSPFPFLLDVPQTHTERVLHDRLAARGVVVERATELVGLVDLGDGVTATLRGPHGPEAADASYVVGCDGAHSTVRRLLGIPFPGSRYADDWLLADVAVDWDRPPDDVHVVFNPGGRAVVFMPLPADRWRVIVYSAPGAPAGPPSPAEIAELVARRVPGPIALRDPSWTARFATHRRSAASYRRGRVFLAGDAAHLLSPAGGQGLNTGLLDAANLGWKLAAVLTAGASEQLLDSYEAERAPVGTQVLALSDRLLRLSAVTGSWRRAARSAAVPAVTHLPGVRARAAGRIAQLSVGYRGGPLTEPGGRAGLRAPGVLPAPGPACTLVVAGGPDDERRLRAWLDRAPGAVRLLRLAPPGTPPGAGVLSDPDGRLARWYRAGGGVHLIRPDGYLAASGTAAVERALQRLYGNSVAERSGSAQTRESWNSSPTSC
ncbi:FAD-dependent monooxygenase [Geodermatophilus sp. URMC 64]